MLIDKLFDKTMPGLEKALDLTWKRNSAITSNITNADTPKYRAMDLNFASELEQAFGNDSQTLTQTNSKHLDIQSANHSHLMPDLSGVTKPDGNNVDIDLQMGRLAYNSGKYTSAANLVRKKLTMIGNAIRQVA